jgi:tetratricopeptide (TPR) repeat protein
LFWIAPLLMAAGSTAASPANTPPQTQATSAPAQSVQQMFDAGTAAIDANDWAKALTIYAALEERLVAKKSLPRSIAIVRLRKGTALFSLGRRDEAEVVAKLALDALPVTDSSLFADRYTGYLLLGDILERRYDYAGASGFYSQALGVASNIVQKTNIYARMIPTRMFVWPQQALLEADAMIALVATEKATSKEWAGVAEDLRGRVLLNMGRTAEARIAFGKAIKLLGGLQTTKSTLWDVAVRSDASIAALRANDLTEARRLLAYTGASMQADQGFALGANMRAPDCGGVNGPKPEDVAVVEFSIKNDGSAGYAKPIYFSGQPTAAIEFARAVSSWSWTPDELKKVLPFFRLQTRLELRCTTMFNRPNSLTMLVEQYENWKQTKAIVTVDLVGPSEAAYAKQMSDELAKREGILGAGSIQLLSLLVELGNSPVIPKAQALQYTARALQIARGESAPPPVRAFLELVNIFASERSRYVNNGERIADRIALLLADPQFAGNLQIKGALAIAAYDYQSNAKRKANGRALLTEIASSANLPANDPLKVGALVRLANLEFDLGNADQAREHYTKSGLSGQQCALVGATPRKTAGGIGSEDYPKEALQWGFAGWTVVEFDIAADGKTLNQRALISFPPFVFGDPTVQQIRSFRYEQSYRPEGGLGCGGQQERVTYRIGI